VRRGRDPRAAGPPGEPHLVTVTTTSYATRDDDRYVLDRVVAVTRREVRNDGAASPQGLWRAVLNGDAATRLLGHEVTRYDGDPFEGLPPGRLGDRGLPARIERLVHTAETLADACRDDAGQPAPPPYLGVPGGVPRRPHRRRRLPLARRP
jgi:hypothetical protein